MNKLEHQREVYLSKTLEVCHILTQKEFLNMCYGDGFCGWNDDYFCIIEQQLGEELE